MWYEIHFKRFNKKCLNMGAAMFALIRGLYWEINRESLAASAHKEYHSNATLCNIW